MSWPLTCRAWSAATIAFPWEDPSGPLCAAALVLSTRETALQPNEANAEVWKPALVGSGLKPSRANGMHALRHVHASGLLDAEQSVRALAEYLGPADPGFTVRVYAHLMPASEEQTGRAADQALRGGALVDGSTARARDVHGGAL